MENLVSEKLQRSQYLSVREKWSRPEQGKGWTWAFDGIHESLENWMSYDYEMRDSLDLFGCKTFDDLVVNIGEKLGRKPHVVDLMGGAYFLSRPENTETLTGIRLVDKDKDFLDAYRDKNNEKAQQYQKLFEAKNRRIIEANILTYHGWHIIEDEKIAKADLLVCRPVGPFDIRHVVHFAFEETKSYAQMYVPLFWRMLGLINKQSGIIFSEIPDIFLEEEIKIFMSEVDEQEKSKSKVFTVPDIDYKWGGRQRRYVVIGFGSLGPELKQLIVGG